MKNKGIIVIAFLCLIGGIYFLIKVPNSPTVDTKNKEINIKREVDSIIIESVKIDTIFKRNQLKTSSKLLKNTKKYENLKDSIHSASFDSLYEFIFSEYSTY